MTPVQCVISAFGGVRKTARALDRNPAAVVQWKRRGLIPNSMQAKILGMARQQGLALTAEDIILGRA